MPRARPCGGLKDHTEAHNGNPRASLLRNLPTSSAIAAQNPRVSVYYYFLALPQNVSYTNTVRAPLVSWVRGCPRHTHDDGRQPLECLQHPMSQCLSSTMP